MDNKNKSAQEGATRAEGEQTIGLLTSGGRELLTSNVWSTNNKHLNTTKY